MPNMIEMKELEDTLPPTREKELEDRISKLIRFVDILIDEFKFSFKFTIEEFEALKEECSYRNIANQ